MLPPGFIAHIMYEFVKKRVKKEHITVSYFIFSGLCFLIFGLVIGVFMFLSKPTSMDAFIRFMSIVPVAMILIGELYAIVCWLIWLRKEN
mgnify:CR=1 FL=1